MSLTDSYIKKNIFFYEAALGMAWILRERNMIKRIPKIPCHCTFKMMKLYYPKVVTIVCRHFFFLIKAVYGIITTWLHF